MIRWPGYKQVRSDPVLSAHASRVLQLQIKSGNTRILVQAHDEGTTVRDVWINPRSKLMPTAEMDHVLDLPYAQSPHPRHAVENGSHDGAKKIPAWERPSSR